MKPSGARALAPWIMWAAIALVVELDALELQALAAGVALIAAIGVVGLRKHHHTRVGVLGRASAQLSTDVVTVLGAGLARPGPGTVGALSALPLAHALSWLDPDIAAHISGGPIPMSDGDIDRVVDELAFPLEVCSSGNYGATLRAVRRLAERGRLDRLTLGSDTPGGTGVIPRGMWRNILFLSSICGLPADVAIAVATGNTGRAHGLSEGVLAVGRPADLLIAGPVEGSAGTTLADAIVHGDLPGITHAIIDGELAISGRSHQTPPPRLRPVMNCCGPR